MRDLTGFQRDLLFVLCGTGPTNGARLKRELERTRYASVLSGQLYHNLDTLVERSLVNKRSDDGRTNRYCLTGAGHKAIAEQCRWQREYLGQTVE